MSFKGRHSSDVGSSRKPWGGNDKAKNGKHSAALTDSRNILRGGGASKQISAAARTFTRNNAGKVGAVLTALLAVILAVSLAMPMWASAATGGQKVVDPDTTNNWENVISPDRELSTQNVGRIWTDKSVFSGNYAFSSDSPLGGQSVAKDEKSNFLVALSALGSTSNLKTMLSSSKPLDIVLVLDESSSMSSNIGGYGSGSRLNALKTAVNNFIGATIEENAEINDEALQHRVSIVTFSDSAKTEIGLTAVNTQNKQQFKNVVDGLRASGNTYPNTGFGEAEDVLANARVNAQKVVIFFTDGVPAPAGTNDFDEEIATKAINSAHSLKQKNTLIYSIGLFNNADPDDTDSDFNQYMNATSSNYPNATAEFTKGWFSDTYTVELGQGSDQGYYKTPTTSDELNNVFQEILDSVLSEVGSGSPIEEVTQQGGQNTPGYLTFTDTLGNYMQVSGETMSLAYGNTIYPSSKGVTLGEETTYSFSGQVDGNDVYAEANLSDIEITVTHSSDLAVGDTVTVKIPASLIPLRNYQVDTDNNTMSVSEAYPVRLFYNVSVKEAAVKALNDPSDSEHTNLIASQTSSNKETIDFYSNSFAKGSAAGSTTATFTPSDGNKFYYFTENTTLYSDENLTVPATQSDVQTADTLYFKDIYWAQDDETGAATEGIYAVPISHSSTQLWREIEYNSSGQAYIPVGTHRTQRPGTLTQVKDTNATATAGNVLTPAWGEGELFVVSLGNNGKLFFAAPGELEIKKTVDWGNASQETKDTKNRFTFAVHLYTEGEDGTQTDLTGSYPYAIYETGENPIEGGTGNISDEGTITLAGGQRVVISNLPNGAKYTVTEQSANQGGFTTIDSSAGEGANTTDGIVEGTIVGGGQQLVSFTNTYHADEVKLSTEATLKVQKNLTGREWQDTDEFIFTMKPEGNAPTPESTADVVVNDETADYTANLSDITFKNPGKYTYVIEEDNDTNPIAGIDYSNETYAVTITVEDNGEGALEISDIAFNQRADVDGNEPAEQPVITNNTVIFTNNYNADAATTNLNGTKVYSDQSGANPNAANKFTFELKAVGGYVTDGGSASNPTIEAAEVPMPSGADSENHTITIGNNGTNPDGFSFQTIAYTGEHLNNTYIYEIREVIPQGATDNQDGTWSLNGMTYDGTVHTITVAVTDEENTQGSGVHIVATPSMSPEDVKFTNTYDPTDATLSGENAIHGTKTLQGREMKDNETFYFQLTQTGGPETVLASPETKTVTKDSGMDFNFSDMTFSKVGTYTFTVNEVADDKGTETTDGSGMTYSQNVAKVTVEVTDKGDGTLSATATYANQSSNSSNETSKAVFTNVYKASMNYGAEGAGGICVTKQMLDRPMAAGEFDFTITGQGEAADLTADVDKNFKNNSAEADRTSTMDKLQSLTFDEADAGKTYTFIVDEADPAEGAALPQVVYDQSQYKVEIEVVDNGNGSMHTLTTVTKIKDSAGKEINEVVIDRANSDADGYQIPGFGFVNDYNPTPAEMGEDTDNPMQVTKKVTGAPSAADYTFTLTATGSNVSAIGGLNENHQATVTTQGTIAADGTQTLKFGKLTFAEPGTYIFTVQEVQPADDTGWEFDTTARTITVKVTDVNPAYEPGGEAPQYDGKLYISEVTGNNPTIENKYDHGTDTIGGETDTPLQVTKKVTGWKTDDDFSFTLTPVEEEGVDWNTVEYEESALKAGVTEHFDADDTQDAKFGEITFTEPGTYKFQVTEDQAKETAPAGWDYDGNTYTITVEVKETNEAGEYDGSLHAAITSDPVTFENKYSAGSGEVDGAASFKGTKTIEGRNGLEDETFGFTLTKGSVEDGVDWSAVSYKAGDAEEAVAFESAEATAAMETNNNSKEFAFTGTFTFAKTGTYTFNVTETEHNGDALPEKTAEPVNGMTYDRHVGTITVTVSDNGSGALQTNVAYGTVGDGADENDMTFENSYAPIPVVYGDDAQEILGGNKNVDDNSGSYIMADDQFTFMMRAQNAGNPMPEGLNVTNDDEGRPIVSVTNKNTNTQNNTATFDFGEITFTKAGTYQYNIYENETNMPAGVSPQNTGRTYTITFEVTEDQATGVLSVKASAVLVGAGDQENIPVALNAIDFTNVYNATAVSGSTQIFKTMSGRNWQQGDTFTFDVSMEVQGVAADEMPTFNFDNIGATVKDFTSEAGKLSYNITITPSASETGNTYAFSTGNATYTHEGTYVYTITERDVDLSIVNVAKDSKTYTVTVNVENVENVLERTVVIDPNTTSGRVDFTNSFVPTAYEGVPEGFTFSKEFAGHEWTKDYSFDFELRAVDGAPMPADAVDGAKTVTVDGPDEENGTTAAFDFGKIKYEKAGTYHYTVSEVVPEEDTENYNAGISYDSHVANVTVTVTEDEDENGKKTGTLSANAVITAEGDDTPAVFTNDYDTNDVTIGGKDSTGIAVQKTLAGRDWEANDGFNFKIEAVTKDAPMPAETEITGLGNDSGKEAASAYFGDITFTKEMLNGASSKEFEYTVTETSTSANGVTVDPSTSRTVTVTVTDDGKGTLTATANHDNSNATTDADKQVTGAAAYTNTYGAAPTEDAVPTNFALTKKFTGHEWTEDYAFEFVLTPASGKLADGTQVETANIPMPKADDAIGVTVDDNGNAHKTVNAPNAEGDGTEATFDFGKITYDKAGVYTYSVSEVDAGQGGVTYDSHPATITVTVTDKDAAGASIGKLVATASVGNGLFENKYETKAEYNAAGAGGLDITKTLNNRNMTADQFTFTIEATGDNKEAAADKLGIADGITTTVKNAAGAAGTATSVIGNPFENIEFDKSDDGVTYTYTIKEEGTSGEGDYAGYTLDSKTFTVSITATDDGDGTMTVKTTVNDGKNSTEYTDKRATVAFENTYKADDIIIGADGAAQIVASKKLLNDEIANYADAFKFQVTSGNAVIAEGTNDRNGNITFDDITYTTENLAEAAAADGSDEVGKATLDSSGDEDVYTFNYSVSEVEANLPGGVTYIGGNTNVTVKVTDDRHGKLSVDVDYESAAGVEFVNTYGASAKAELNLKGNKEIVPGEGLTNAPTLEDDTFTFEIAGNAASDGTPAPMPEERTTTNKNGAVSFGPITFTMENVFGTPIVALDATDEEEQAVEDVAGETEAEKAMGEESGEKESESTTAGAADVNADVDLLTAGRSKTFTYTIKETAGSVAGVTNDTSEKTVSVTVTDEGEGKISVKATSDKNADAGNDFTFTNVYKVDPKESSLTGDGGFTLKKELQANTDRVLGEGEFTFQLIDPADGSVVAEAKNAADGTISMPTQKFTKPGDYTYTLKEVNESAAGIDYDDAAYTVIAHVTDKDANGNYTGKLEVTWKMPQVADKAVTFTNTYTADPTSVALGAGKLIQGRGLDAGEFSFKLADADGNEVSTATNEETGAVTFDTITYDKPGEYTYTITEVAPEDTDPNTEGIQNNGVTYDETVYNVTVKVTDNEEGKLNASIAYATEDGGAPLFVNTYEEPVVPASPVEPIKEFMAKTGDFMGGIMAAIAAVVAAAAAGATYAIRKMRRPRGRHVK